MTRIVGRFGADHDPRFTPIEADIRTKLNRSICVIMARNPNLFVSEEEFIGNFSVMSTPVSEHVLMKKRNLAEKGIA